METVRVSPTERSEQDAVDCDVSVDDPWQLMSKQEMAKIKGDERERFLRNMPYLQSSEAG